MPLYLTSGIQFALIRGLSRETKNASKLLLVQSLPKKGQAFLKLSRSTVTHTALAWTVYSCSTVHVSLLSRWFAQEKYAARNFTISVDVLAKQRKFVSNT